VIPYDPNQALISLHIPKTAGTSFRAVLQAWFGEGLHDHYPDHGKPLGGVALGPGVCIHGHFNRDKGLGVQDCYPQARQFITVLREPFARMISLWLFLNREQAAGRTQAVAGFADFDAWFGHHRDAALANPAAGFLRNFPMPVTPEGVPTLFDRDFVAVGITERMQETVDHLARALGRPTIAIGRDNVSPEDAGPFQRYRAEHERVFHLEHALYAEGLRRFDQAAR
jgi:hypothetical protein